MNDVYDALSALRAPLQQGEYDLHRLVMDALDAAGLPWEHEVRLAPRCRIDLMCGSVGIEIKRGKPEPARIRSQLARYAACEQVLAAEETLLLDALSSAGRLAAVPERLVDVGSSVMGCGVAWLALFLEALADGAVACGLPRAQALEFAAQMAAGTGKLLLETGQHPGVMKDICCSPGGTTIQGIRVLENAGVRGAVIDAVIAAYQRSLELN